jgi:aspartyl/glutamyl-tRNA(Asn/Gln) amidotransferase C subunit
MSSAKLGVGAVSKVAKLARISKELSAESLSKYELELNSILEHVSELQKVDVSSIQPLSGIRTISVDNLRPDQPDQDLNNYAKVRSNIIANFPEKQGDYLVISGIFQ